jgi:hypothetical protein
MITDCAIGHHRLISFVQNAAKHSSISLTRYSTAQSRLCGNIAVVTHALLYVQQFHLDSFTAWSLPTIPLYITYLQNVDESWILEIRHIIKGILVQLGLIKPLGKHSSR